MTIHDQRFDQALPSLFVELASASVPEYLEAAIERASSRPQRPAWTYPGRWLPVDITTQAVPAARMPWRQLGILALIGLLLVVAAVAYVGSQRNRPAPPFGIARNGAIAMVRDGDIVTVDHATSTITQITSGPDIDSAPIYAPDGTKIGFQRAVEGQPDKTRIMVVDADGTGLIEVTEEPLSLAQLWGFSPDGQTLLATASVDGGTKILIQPVDGTGEPTVLDVGLPSDPDGVEPISFRPPDGREILAMPAPDPAKGRGIVAIGFDTGEARTIIEPSAGVDMFGAAWSPNGDAVTFGRYTSDGVRARIVNADGTNDRLIDPAGVDPYDIALRWSNDGTRLLFLRMSAELIGQPSVLTIDGSKADVELRCGSTDGACDAEVVWIWSPDDAALLGTHEAVDGSTTYYVADPQTGLITPTDWTGTGHTTWQRLAP